VIQRFNSVPYQDTFAILDDGLDHWTTNALCIQLLFIYSPWVLYVVLSVQDITRSPAATSQLASPV